MRVSRENFCNAAVLLLCCLFGYLSGRIVDIQLAQPATTLVPDATNPVAVVQVLGIQNGELFGSIKGDVRFFLADTQVVTHGSGDTFRMSADVFLENNVTIVVPDGMYFVASRNGKKYYAVDSSGGERIVPKNRVYFPTAAAAEAAGFLP